MEQESFYTINVLGKKPVEVQVGLIDKKSEQPAPGWQMATQELGELAIPNYSRAWGKLLMGTDKKPNGEIKFLPWGDPDGRVLRIRHLKNCQSISMDYQIEKKLVPAEDESEIFLKVGYNKFNNTTQKELVLLLKHHALNRSNGSKDPAIKLVRFETWAANEMVNVKASEIELKHRAEQIVLDVHTKVDALHLMAKVFDIDTDQPEEKIFNKLIQYAQEPKVFLDILAKAAEVHKKVLTRAAEIELIDISSEDVKIIIGGAKDILLTGVEGNNIDERIEFITDNFTQPMYYHALNRLSGELERFKEVSLQ